MYIKLLWEAKLARVVSVNNLALGQNARVSVHREAAVS